MKRIILLLFILATALSASAQKEATWWYFRTNQGLDFTKSIENKTMPTAICDGPIIQTEGVFSISDKDGNFLMASDGKQVYGRDRLPMIGTPNNSASTDLWGSGTSTQSGIVVPYPGDKNKYYIITKAARESNTTRRPLAYTIIDMTLGPIVKIGTDKDGIDIMAPRGDLLNYTTAKNQEMFFNTPVDADGNFDPLGANGGGPTEAYENVTAIPHTNGTDQWVITRTKRGYYAWLIDENGVSTEPKFQQANFGPTVQPGQASIVAGDGHIRATTDGKHIISAIYSSNGTGESQGNMTYVNFDAEKGKFSGLKTLALGTRMIFGLDFSVDGKYIYMTQNAVGGNNGGLFRMETQYIIDNGSTSTTNLSGAPALPINTAANQIVSTGTTVGLSNAQIGPHGWLYMIQNNQNNLWVVTDPTNGNIEEVKSSVKPNAGFFTGCGISLGTGLPTFMPSFFDMGQGAGDDNICKNHLGEYHVTVKQGQTPTTIADFLRWEMGDEDNSIKKSGVGAWPSDGYHEIEFAYKKAGKYSIKIIACKNDPADPDGGIGIPLDDVEISNIEVQINECVIPINPHLRSRIMKK